MAIYGLNFNNTEIPQGLRRKSGRFAAEVTLANGAKAQLQGVCNTEEEREQMRMQATNETRRVYTTERVTPLREDGRRWFLIYCWRYMPTHWKAIGTDRKPAICPSRREAEELLITRYALNAKQQKQLNLSGVTRVARKGLVEIECCDCQNGKHDE